MNNSFNDARINAIIEKINKGSVIVDVGCDHCYTSIYCFNKKNIKFAYNIDINKKPIENGINNLKRFNLLKKTKNIIGNGLQTYFSKIIDFAILTGIGSNTIIDILEKRNNKNKIKKYIFLVDKKPETLRNYLLNNKYKIIFEKTLIIKNVFYHLIIAKKQKNKIKFNDKDVYLGKYNYTHQSKEFILYIKNIINKHQKIKKQDKQTKILTEFCNLIS